MSDLTPENAVQFALVRDFRLPGGPMGYLVVQTEQYYAWWQVHEPDTLTVHAADANDLAWMRLRLGALLEVAGEETPATPARVELANRDELSARVPGREWAGNTCLTDQVALIFRTVEGPRPLEITLRFLPDHIEYTVACELDTPTRIRRCTLGLSANGRTALEATRLFNAGPNSPGITEAPLTAPQYIRPDWFTPPPYCYAYAMRDETWMSAALEAPVGAMPFTRFLTEPDGHGHQAFTVVYDSEPAWMGRYDSPPLVFRFGAHDALTALWQHAQGMVTEGRVPPVERHPADWWRGVMACGWHWQTQEGPKRGLEWGDACRQDIYEEMVAALEAQDISFDILTIDMFWGVQHGLWEVDTARWPDLRGFIERQHQQDRRVLLWICTNTFGLPDDELYIVGERKLLDPLNPQWQARVADYCRTMFGDGPDCLHADGLKFDFTEMMPPAGPAQCTRELHGLNYLHALFTTVHDAAKAVRPDVLLDFQVAHPAFAGLYDMTRLNDFFLPARQDVRVMRRRAEIAQAVGFGALVDVDGPASVPYFLQSPKFGNMSLYLSPDHLADPVLVQAIKDGIARQRRTR